jgi:UPF0271 protein
VVAAGSRGGLRTAREGFADRAYQKDGTLVPRHVTGAVIRDPENVVNRALAMAREHVVVSLDGSRVELEVDTICLHGDTPGAAALASRIREALTEAGVSVLAVGEPAPRTDK